MTPNKEIYMQRRSRNKYWYVKRHGETPISTDEFATLYPDLFAKVYNKDKFPEARGEAVLVGKIIKPARYVDNPGVPVRKMVGIDKYFMTHDPAWWKLSTKEKLVALVDETKRLLGR